MTFSNSLAVGRSCAACESVGCRANSRPHVGAGQPALARVSTASCERTAGVIPRPVLHHVNLKTGFEDDPDKEHA